MYARLVLLGSFAAGVGTLYLISRLWRYRRRPGAKLFVAALFGQVVFCFGYGAGLLVFDPFWREVIVAILLIVLPLMSVLFLGFAFGYTGRGHLLETVWYRVPLATAIAWVGLIATNSYHGLAWQEFAVTPVGPVAGATFTHEPALFVMLALGTLWVGLATMLLFETVISYGPLFRGEALAVGLSPLPPGIAIALWLFEAGPEPALNLGAVAFLPHIVLDSYAFVKRDMFEFLPGTRRAGEQAAIRDLGSPVVIVGTDGRIVALNEAAENLIGLEEDAALTRPLGDVLEANLELSGEDQQISVRNDGERTEYVVTPAELTDTEGTLVGYTLVFQDVTEAIQREQRLTVMNRVLRHNLRNDLNVVHAALEAGQEQVEEEALASMLDRAASTAWGLVETGEKVREIESMMHRSEERDSVDIQDLLRDVVSGFETDDSTVSLDAPASLSLRTNPELLGVIVENLLENAIEHGSLDDGTVQIQVTDSDDHVRIDISDQGPGIPENELEAIERGTETDLVHGSGLGLWLATWGVQQLGGELDFDSGSGGTTASLTLPRKP